MPKRLVVALVATAVLVVGGTAIALTIQRFPDVPPEHPAHEAVEWAADVGLGYDTYMPAAGRGSGGFYLGPADHELYRPRAGSKYVTVSTGSGRTSVPVHWVLVLTRTE